MVMQSVPVMAHWQFELEEETGTWQGFSPAVSGTLEAAYAQWTEDPLRGSKRVKQVRSDHFIYAVDFASMTDETDGNAPARKSQRIRRISLTEAENAQLCTVDGELWKEVQLESERLKARFAEEEKHLEEMKKELQECRVRCSMQEKEISVLRQDLQVEREQGSRLIQHLSGIFPGRLIALAAGFEQHLATSVPLSPGALGRVRSVEGQAAAVNFSDAGQRSLWLPQACLEIAGAAELLTRPGMRVLWYDSEGRQRFGVVCDSVVGESVTVLDTQGQRCICSMQNLQADCRLRSADAPLETGDIVKARSEAAFAKLKQFKVPSDRIGMVIQSGEGDLVVRFTHEEGLDACSADEGASRNDRVVDLDFKDGEMALQRDEAADCVRPGVAVRFREGVNTLMVQGQSPVGLVYATHADCSVVVDFLGNMGCRCDAACLQVEENPPAGDLAVLRLLGECLSWHEVSSQRTEDRDQSGLVRFLGTLPSTLLQLEAPAGEYAVTEWSEETDIFHFVAQLLLRSVRGHRPLDGSCERCDAPELSVEQVEGISNPSLQRAYELGLKSSMSLRGGCVAKLADTGAALRVPGSPQASEVFLWHGAGSPEVSDQICRHGFVAPARFLESASEADLCRRSDPTGTRCVLLARVLLDDSAESQDQREDGDEDRGVDYTLRDPSKALPLFRVFFRYWL